MSTKEPIPRVTMTPDEKLAIKLLDPVRMLPASWEKRFRNFLVSMLGTREPTISQRESAQLWRLFIRYRRQIDHPEKERLLRIAEPLAALDLKKAAKMAVEQKRIDDMRRKIAVKQEKADGLRPQRVFDLE